MPTLCPRVRIEPRCATNVLVHVTWQRDMSLSPHSACRFAACTAAQLRASVTGADAVPAAPPHVRDSQLIEHPLLPLRPLQQEEALHLVHKEDVERVGGHGEHEAAHGHLDLSRAGILGGHAPDLQAVIGLMKERVNTINELADAAMLFYRMPDPAADLLAQHLNELSRPALQDYATRCQAVEWKKEALSVMLKEVLAAHKLKMPQMAMPLRLLNFWW